MLGTQEVPRVDRYTYLGINIDKNLSKESMVDSNVAKGIKALTSLKRFLCRRIYPTHLKVLLIKAKLIPILTYGGEIWGMNTQITSKAQKVCDNACRMCIRGGKNTGLRLLRDELGIDSIASITASKRHRALGKFAELKTWISVLIQQKAKSRYDTWISGGLRWMKTYVSEEQGNTSKRRLVNVFVEREKRKDKTVARTRARDLGLTLTQPWMKMEALHPELCEMLTEVGRMRIGIFPTGKQLVYQRSLSSDFRNRCPVCGDSTPETLEHLFCVCPMWKEAREQHLVPCFPNWKNLVTLPTAMTLVVGVLLGGERGKPAGESSTHNSINVEPAMFAINGTPGPDRV